MIQEKTRLSFRPTFVPNHCNNKPLPPYYQRVKAPAFASFGIKSPIQNSMRTATKILHKPVDYQRLMIVILVSFRLTNMIVRFACGPMKCILRQI